MVRKCVIPRERQIDRRRGGHVFVAGDLPDRFAVGDADANLGLEGVVQRLRATSRHQSTTTRNVTAIARMARF
jgi:hypothetical protein